MATSIKLKNNTFIDSTGIVHGRTLLSEMLDNRFNLITNGNPVKAGYKIDGRDVYVKRLTYNVTTTGDVNVPTGVTGLYDLISFDGYIESLPLNIPLNYYNKVVNAGNYCYFNKSANCFSFRLGWTGLVKIIMYYTII